MKFYGVVGFWIKDVEVSSGVFKPKIVEKMYYGDIKKNNRRWQESDQINDVLKVNNTITILSDLFARQNLASIKYVIFNGTKLKVTQVTLDYPLLSLEIGGMYNGENSPDST